MKLTKEQVYVDLQGKSKEELTDLWEFLDSIGEKCYRNKEFFSETNIQYRCLHLSNDKWGGYDDDEVKGKTEVTIEQLKEILQPMELSLTEQLQKAEAEVKRLKEEINKPKVGDWAMLWEDDEETPVFGLITDVTDFYLTCNGSWEYAKKITNKQLIELLENESRIIKE